MVLEDDREIDKDDQDDQDDLTMSLSFLDFRLLPASSTLTSLLPRPLQKSDGLTTGFPSLIFLR